MHPARKHPVNAIDKNLTLCFIKRLLTGFVEISFMPNRQQTNLLTAGSVFIFGLPGFVGIDETDQRTESGDQVCQIPHGTEN